MTSGVEPLTALVAVLAVVNSLISLTTSVVILIAAINFADGRRSR